MRRYFIVDKNVWLANVGLFSTKDATGSHYIDLDLPAPDDNLILACCWFHDESHEMKWERAVGADGCLPHPAHEGTKKLHKQKHIDKLSQKLGMKQDDTVLDISKALRDVHPSMALTQFDSA